MEPKVGGRYALIVAIDRYTDTALTQLRAPAADAAALAEVLGDPSIGRFDVEVLANPGAHQLRLRVEDFFAGRSPADQLLLHFSCHGIKTREGRLTFATTDTRQDRLAATAVSADFVCDLMNSCRAQRITVFLDCCYAGAVEREMLRRSGPEVHIEEEFRRLRSVSGNRGRAILSASSAVEVALEYDGIRDIGAPPTPSVFTEVVVRGLRSGAADRNGDGWIGMAELAEYVSMHVRERIPHQNPEVTIIGAHGDMIIARAPRREVVPAPVSPEITAALRHRHPDGRGWAISRLGEVAQGTDVRIAASAIDLLRGASRDPVPALAYAAQMRLAAVAPRVEIESWELLASGAETVVPIGGPPIARATLNTGTAPPWLRIRFTPGGVVLAVVPGTAEGISGVVHLESLTGRAGLKVTVGPRRAARWLPWHPPAVLGSWLVFASAAVLMVLVIVLPEYQVNGGPNVRLLTNMQGWGWENLGGFDNNNQFVQGISAPYAVVPISALLLGGTAVLAAVRHGIVRYAAYRWVYVITAVVNGYLYLSEGAFLNIPTTDYFAGPGFQIWLPAWILQAMGAVVLWTYRLGRDRPTRMWRNLLHRK